jgi:hypothetical protein
LKKVRKHIIKYKNDREMKNGINSEVTRACSATSSRRIYKMMKGRACLSDRFDDENKTIFQFIQL